MDLTTEHRLLNQLVELRRARRPFTTRPPTRSPLERYIGSDTFDAEREQIFRKVPLVVAHRSEVSEPGSFVTRTRLGTPLLIVRAADERVRAFLNVCRHRGASVVRADEGCQKRFSCPYHAWTYDDVGHLVGVPARDVGFPDLDLSERGLVELACEERHGLIWVQLEPGSDLCLDTHLGAIGADLAWLSIEDLEVWDISERTWNANWKILIEGGLESYHFQVAHRDTIAYLFAENLSTFEVIGRHVRSLLPKRTIDDLPSAPRDEWRLRRHANVLYNLFPATALLVQPSHIAMLEFLPVAADRTHVRIVTLVPAKPTHERTDRERENWDFNHSLPVRAFDEDFVLAEEIQVGMATDANQHFLFGTFEGALDDFHRVLDASLGRVRRDSKEA